MRRADIEVPNLPVDGNSRGRSACYPQGSFYPMSDGLSIQHRRITRTDFRLCSICLSRSQANLYPYALLAVSIRHELTFARLRYSLGGDRPSQTAHLTVSSSTIQSLKLDVQHPKGGIPTMAPQKPKFLLLSLPPILCMKYQTSVSGYSKAPWGLSVPPRLTGVLTGTTISLDLSLRQRSNRYAIRAGRNLPDKEFRYLRTVIVTAAVYWGFDLTLCLATNISS